MENMYHPASVFREIEIHKDHNYKWRWRISKNSRIIATAEEGFDEKDACVRNLKTYALEILQWVKSAEAS